MKGVQYLTDAKGSKTALLINLKKHDKSRNELVEDLLDVIECETLKDEPKVSFEKVINSLYKKSKLSKKAYDKLLAE
jgi:hypothetical protein